MNDDNGDGVGVERYASSGHGVLPMAWQSQTASSYAPPALRDMDSFVWASVSRSTAMTGASLFPPAASGRLRAYSCGLRWARAGRAIRGVGLEEEEEIRRETERAKDANGEETGPAAAAGGTSKVKGAKDAGEATEGRLRREKISQRMKLLQDLVPGCNKVTGKTVMLDEIINYVQSLQRQVEFLAMKLSAVNPTLGVNLESLVAKDVLRFPWSPSTPLMGLSFTQEMMPKPSQPGMLQCDVHGMANSDMFRTIMQSFSQEPPSQVHHALSGSFDGVYSPLVIGSEDSSIRPEQNQFHM
ncbi:hypothetical protein ACQ4PT_072285 [Festuca glaucescens]